MAESQKIFLRPDIKLPEMQTSLWKKTFLWNKIKCDWVVSMHYENIFHQGSFNYYSHIFALHSLKIHCKAQVQVYWESIHSQVYLESVTQNFNIEPNLQIISFSWLTFWVGGIFECDGLTCCFRVGKSNLMVNIILLTYHWIKKLKT